MNATSYSSFTEENSEYKFNLFLLAYGVNVDFSDLVWAKYLYLDDDQLYSFYNFNSQLRKAAQRQVVVVAKAERWG